MTWQGVPWAIGAWTTVDNISGQPEVPAEAARMVAYQAAGGSEGPAAAGDCAVVPLAVPGAGVLIRPGGLGVLNRSSGGAGQSYVVRQPEEETVPITATGSGGGRTDLVAVVVQDPQYPGQPVPADGAAGPYVVTKVYEGVSATADKLSDVDPGQSGYALARITLPASTGTVQATHITDLRTVANPKARPVTKIVSIGNEPDVLQAAADWERFPQQAGWSVLVPRWATTAHLVLQVAGVKVSNDGDAAGDWKGRGRLKLGTIATEATELNPTPPDANRTDTFPYMAAGELAIPAAMRGTFQTLEAQAFRISSSSGVTVKQGWGTVAVATVTFFEDASSDQFTV